MTTTARKTFKQTREGFHTITPYLRVREVHELVEFVKQAFDAERSILGTGSEGGFHSEFRIGDSMLEVSDRQGEWQPMPTVSYLYADD